MPPRDRNASAAGPREAPPPIREERVRPRGRGWVWIPGFYNWVDGRWEWTGGRWEKTRPGRRWRPVTWELRDGVYVRVDGDWIDDRPNQAPPPLREERWENRRGFTWVPGRWDWENGQYVWVEGRYEQERRGKRWRPDRWDLQGGVWVRIEGGWDDDIGSYPTPGGYPSQAPPPPRAENPGAKGGHIWIRGRWDWRNGQYVWIDGHWERERARERWNDGRWENRNGRWEWVEGSWGSGPASCSAEPPLNRPPPDGLKPETIRETPGKFEVKGHWAWDARRCEYTWSPGYLESYRQGSRYVPGNWNQGNGRWYWVEPRWEGAASCAAEPPLNRPPPDGLKPETIRETPGKFEVKGHWQWDARRCEYTWSPGYLESYRQGYRYVPGNWNQGNGRWYYVEPRWEREGAPPAPPAPAPPSPSYPGNSSPPPPSGGPSAPPPAPRAENPGTKGGFVWVRGHYEWRSNNYEWVDGHWERERARQRWVDGRWELQGRVYVWIPGFWQ